MASRHSAAIQGWLLAHVGGTRARLAFLAAGGTLGPICVADNDRSPDLRALIASGLETIPKDRSRLGAALAVAAPVVGDAVAMTNRDWDFSIADLRRELGVAPLHDVPRTVPRQGALSALSRAHPHAPHRPCPALPGLCAVVERP